MRGGIKVAVFGLGYVGTVTAAGLAARGHQVVGVDVDAAKVEAIRAGRSPVVEPGVLELIDQGRRNGRLDATTQAREAIEEADVSLICVGTPSGAHGEVDLAHVSRCLADLRKAMSEATPPASGHHAVVIRSTVPPTTGERVVAPAFAGRLPAGWSVGTAMCPEFLREGSGVADFFDPPFVVLGTGDQATSELLVRLFSFLDLAPHHCDVLTAEALKYACNAFHATKVTFANEIARVFRPHGVDSREVMRLLCEDRKLNISTTYLRPGFAFGGSCLPKDLRALQHLARTGDVDVPLLMGTTLSNELGVRDVVDRIIRSGLRRVAILGLSFKSDTDDLRESPNVDLAERLLGKGFEVSIYDPIVNPDRLIGSNRRDVVARLPHLSRLLTDAPEDALAAAEIAVVSSSDPETMTALVAAAPALVLDLDGRLGEPVERLPGYEGIGW